MADRRTAPIRVVIVGHGLAGRWFHAPLVRRQSRMALQGIVARDPQVRAEAVSTWSIRGYSHLDEALTDPSTDLVVIATPHDTHADLAIRVLQAGKPCVVDKVMALSADEADRMIAARDAAGQMLSVFHNRRWDWDFLTVKEVLTRGLIGRPLWLESSVCRYAPPRTWRGRAAEAGTILHDWGAHLIDQALQLGFGPCRRLSAWITPAPWEGVDSGGHGRIVLEFDGLLFQVETSRISRLDRPRWWVLGTEGGLWKSGIDPQEQALRDGDLDDAHEPDEHRTFVHRGSEVKVVQTIRGGWDAYYANIADHLLDAAPLVVTAEQAREVVRVLDAACMSARYRGVVEGPWGE